MKTKADLKVGDLFMYKVFTIVGEEIGFVKRERASPEG